MSATHNFNPIESEIMATDEQLQDNLPHFYNTVAVSGNNPKTTS